MLRALGFFLDFCSVIPLSIGSCSSLGFELMFFSVGCWAGREMIVSCLLFFGWLLGDVLDF